MFLIDLYERVGIPQYLTYRNFIDRGPMVCPVLERGHSIASERR
jgi:hypothetical protein